MNEERTKIQKRWNEKRADSDVQQTRAELKEIIIVCVETNDEIANATNQDGRHEVKYWDFDSVQHGEQK